MPSITRQAWRRLPRVGLAAAAGLLATSCAILTGQQPRVTPVPAAAATAGQAVIPAPATACQPGVNAAEFWLMGAGELHMLQAAVPVTVRLAVKPADLFVAERPGGTSPIGQTVADFKSYAGFAQTVARGSIARGTHWVMYDNERWPQTPVNEQRDPRRYEAMFASLAHRHGYKVILAPAQDLVPGYSRDAFRRGHSALGEYLSAGFPTFSAHAADIYEIQAQPYELGVYRHDSAYQRFITAATARARAANPKIVIFAGLSTNRVSAISELGQDFSAVRARVSGFWLNIPRHQRPGPLELAGGFLHGLPRGAGAAGRTCGRA